jgi:predicted permease
MDTLLQDLRFAVRNLRRTPTFPLAAIATLALGIGATTAIFSTVNAAVLKPLPYKNPQDLYSVKTALTDGRPTTGLMSPVELRQLTPEMGIQSAVGVIPQDVTLLRNDGTPMNARVYGVSQGFFDLFGVGMTLGGGFTPADFKTNQAPSTVISYQVWQDIFGHDPAIIGKQLHFGPLTSTVVGVAPPDFDVPHGAGFWFSFGLDPQGQNHSFDGYIRLIPGGNIERTKSQMGAAITELGRQFPASDASRIFVVRPLAEAFVGDLGPILIVVLSATGLLLVLACVNVANLLLARGAARAREMAVRVALGANRSRIVRQLLTESILLATAGGLLGVGLAYGGVRMLLAVSAGKLPRLGDVPFDANVLLFALVALLVSGVLIGFAPAVRLAATDVKTLMNESGRATSGGRATGRWLSAMTVAEVALAIALVAGAGWLVQSFARLWTTNPGFVADHRLVFDVALQGPRYPNQPALLTAWRDLTERLRNLPGAGAVGGTSNFPLAGSQENSIYVQFQGEPVDPIHPNGTRQRVVSAGFFDAMGMTIVSGRGFTVDDRAANAPVVIVNQTFARLYLQHRDPFTTRFAAGYPTIDPSVQNSIVGIVDDVRQVSLADLPQPSYYTLSDQQPTRRLTMVVHTTSPDLQAIQVAIRDEVRRFDPQIAVDFRTATDVVASTLQRQELGMRLMLVFGVAAVILAAVGIYGVIAYATSQRQNEVATRLALGATPGQVFRLVLKEGRTLTLIGAVIGLGVAYAAGRVVSSQVASVQASDWRILSSSVAVVVVIAFLATTVPAFRASRLDPAKVLRPE